MPPIELFIRFIPAKQAVIIALQTVKQVLYLSVSPTCSSSLIIGPTYWKLLYIHKHNLLGLLSECRCVFFTQQGL